MALSQLIWHIIGHSQREVPTYSAPMTFMVAARVQAADRSLTELKEFAGQLKALPQIQRHIALAEAVNQHLARPATRTRVAIEQALLDGHGLDATCESIEVRQLLLVESVNLFNKLFYFCVIKSLCQSMVGLPLQSKRHNQPVAHVPYLLSAPHVPSRQKAVEFACNLPPRS